ncbi:MAG: hypothetical protein IPL79_18955 [Myxococcales bacterium]|nr:hypothetical protein [Myxococcales bacterium]
MNKIPTLILIVFVSTLGSAAHASRSKTPLQAEFKAAQKRAAKVARSPRSRPFPDLNMSMGTKTHRNGSTKLMTNPSATSFTVASYKSNGEIIGSTTFEQTPYEIKRTKISGEKRSGEHALKFAEFAEEDAQSGKVTIRSHVTISHNGRERATLVLFIRSLKVRGTITPAMKQDKIALIKAAADFGSKAQLMLRRALAK